MSDDLPDLIALFADPRVGATLGGQRSPDESEAVLRRWRTQWKDRGFGPWVFRETVSASGSGSGSFVGYAGLAPADAVEPGSVELLYAVRPALWRQGYASEMGHWVLHVAPRPPGCETVVAYTLPSNAGSRRVLEKLAFASAGTITHTGLPHLLFREEVSR
ncbi:MAG: GNAT family N-acetyltransferase [Myxococcota bacterium]